MAEPLYFQWQNEVLRRDIYGMRIPKLIDFLVFYKEIDIWKEYKGRDISELKADVDEYVKAQETAAVAAYKAYTSLRGYFMLPDVRAYYSKYKPIDEEQMNYINNLHSGFIQSWPKDIRGERGFVEGQIQYWVNIRNGVKEWIKGRRRYLDNMLPDHPSRPAKAQELALKENSSLPMAEQELDQLRAFLATYDKIEQRKLAWYKLTKSDPGFTTPEAEFLVHYKPDKPITVTELADWRSQQYRDSLANKNQYELLEEIYKRFQNEPKRFPYWLQYMVVHYSGMRYASAHGSWADPKDLLFRLQSPAVAQNVSKLDDVEIEKRCAEKVALYESAGAKKPKLALSTDKEWQYKLSTAMINVKAKSAPYRRKGLIALLTEELSYDIRSRSTEEVLKTIESMRAQFPRWMWKEIVRFTPLRTNHAEEGWEKLSPEDEAERNKPESGNMCMLMDAWENADLTAWRAEHARSHELIVTRAVCNETAEHIQHIRGHQPPGGLTPKPKWYATNETENKLPGEIRPFYVKPTSEKDYVPGASIFWLRFVDKEPNQWQIAKGVKTKDEVGLLPGAFPPGPKLDPKSKTTGWTYQKGETVTRFRMIENPQTKVASRQSQWLRWIHEATVAEVGETSEGMMVITFETALPGGDKSTSCLGIHKMPLWWHLSDGTEEAYNRAFVGFVPEGQVPMEHLKTMLDWSKVLRKKI